MGYAAARRIRQRDCRGSGRYFVGRETELEALVKGRANHPCIVMWVPYNEGWGQWDTARIVDKIKSLDSTRLVDLDYVAAIDALIAGEIDAAMFPLQVDDSLLQRTLAAPGVRLMDVAQAEAVSKHGPRPEACRVMARSH